MTYGGKALKAEGIIMPKTPGGAEGHNYSLDKLHAFGATAVSQGGPTGPCKQPKRVNISSRENVDKFS